jgi:excisionase family DNA binding protein
MTVPEAGKRLGLGRISSYQAAKRGELPVLRFGRRLLVPKPAFEEMLRGKQREAARVTEFYSIDRLRDTQIYRVSHPQDSERSYLVNAYPGEENCTCPAFREATGCKHIAAIKQRFQLNKE